LSVAGVSRSAYYAWGARKDAAEERQASVRAKVVDKFYFHKRTYGSKRLSDELKDEGVKAGRYFVRRVMREEGLRAKSPTVYRPRTTDSSGTRRPSPNLLKDVDNTRLGGGEVIVGDFTYLRMKSGGFCYLATFQDVKTKRVVGWNVRERMPSELVCEALRMGLRRGLINKNAIVHTDRGSQYASDDFKRLLSGRLIQSMSGKGNCYDNAQAESFFSRFKAEIDTHIFGSVEEARSTAFDYIECYYNRIRRHTTLGMTIPRFEKQLKEGCGNAAHMEIAENLKRGFPQFPQSLGKVQSGFPTFPQPRLLDTNQKGDQETFLS
jgi:transposase InsO family protein